MKNKKISYAITAKDLAAHMFQVSMTIEAPAPEGQVLVLPAWIPGSYMIREFSRNIVQIRAEAGGQPVELAKLDKHSWQAPPVKGKLTVHYEVYAWDLSVRAAHLDQTHGFFNGTSVFLRAVGQEDEAHIVDIQRPAHEAAAKWRVATALKELKAKRYGFGTYIAGNYDELIDSPVEMGTFEMASFKALGVQHDVVFTGRVPNLDIARVCADLKKICETQIAFFEPRTKKAPMDRYVFMTMVTGDGYGGLEHRASTALFCSRSDLPTTAQKGKEPSEGYMKFLGLCSHEYFHTWNVKRIKPAVFAPYDYQVENYTPLLWLFEGFTSYYDDLLLVRAGLLSEEGYYKMLGKTVGAVLRGSGRTKQSVADSSFDAWGKYYRQDENSPNAIVSYYAKGSLVGLGLDLTIRAKTNGKRSLDDIMRALWQKFGRDFYSGKPRGVTPAEVEALFDSVAGFKLKTFFDKYIKGTDDLPLAKLLPQFGVGYKDERKSTKPSMDVNLGRDGADCKLSAVHDGGAAQKAGLSANDLLVAIDGLRVTGNPANVDGLLARYKVGDTVQVHAFRRDELMAFDVTLQGDHVPGITIAVEQQKTSLRRPTA
ncbi:PDZ domain-containing protein [Pseudoduganella eburnea]|uniref:PDZ domain-containing protein n=1 Tax=Massilia eburnea TaxID=1776165 RepID=A0A6L6QN20_9BURK|nr:M61 family metallopeptidase [Massilia eburnea]MTW13610.1 PDZ domain-containing protein [Massilia eburnea]